MTGRMFLVLLVMMGCSKTDDAPVPTDIEVDRHVFAVDISSFPEIEATNAAFFNRDKEPVPFLSILKSYGVNTIRLRLWVNPITEHSGLEEVESFAQRLKEQGFKIWLTVHYSDTWADPGQQVTPVRWQGMEFQDLLDSVGSYTQEVVRRVAPEFVQIGNEINSGLLHPSGNINEHPVQMKELLTEAIESVRMHSSDTRIIIHFAGIEGADWFYEQVKDLDYDIIGVSYYPLWHGKDLNKMTSQLQQLSAVYKKEILIAETAYPFTLEWNDWTNNVVGMEDQLILPDFPATPEGQKKFLEAIKSRVLNEVPGGLGFCYWGAELVAWKGEKGENASAWENQALFDFSNAALPACEVFKSE